VARFVRFVIIGWAAGFLAACGGAPPPVDATAPTGPVTRSVTAAGATLRVVGDDRGVLELIFPPDGVFEDVEVTVSPGAAAQGARARFDVVPAGVLLQKPVEMLYTAPGGVDLEARSTFAVGPYEDLLVMPSTRQGAVSLTTRTWVLGAAEPESLGMSSAHGGAGTAIHVGDVECQLALGSLQQQFDMAQNFPFSSAQSGAQLIAQIEATKLLCEPAFEGDDVEGRFDAVRPILQEKACAGYRDASVNATLVTVDSARTLKAVMGPLLNWEATKQATGTDCGRSDREILDDLGPKFDEFIDAYKGKIASGALPTTYDDLWQEVRGALYAYGHASLINLPAAADKVQDELLGIMFDLLRDAAYGHCRSDGRQEYLVDLLLGGRLYRRPLTPLALPQGVAPNLPQWANFTADALQDDIQYCASRVVIEVFTPLARLVGEYTRTLEGSATPGTHVTKASTRSPATGSIGLGGAIGAFQCRSPDRSSDDVLVVRLNGTEVDRITRSGRTLLGSQRTLDVGEMLTKAGLDPTLKRTYPLVLEREGESCDGLYGHSPTKLFTFDLEIDPAPTLSGVTANVSSILADLTENVAFSLAFADEGRNLKEARATFALPGSAGSSVLPLADSDRVAGFGEERGTGTITPAITIFCSEQGKNPLRVEFVLVDGFDQESEPRGVDLTVAYDPCEG
jgi:hypothetical protein